MRILGIYVLAIITFIPFIASATESGVIKTLTMSGPNDVHHINVAQIDFGSEIMNTPGCNKRFAAIRNDRNNTHLISLAISALVTKTSVTIDLNSADIYFSADSRCTISRLSVSE